MTVFFNFLTMLNDAVPDTSFVTKDVPSQSPPVCIVDSVERDRVVPSDPSVHVYDVPVSTTSSSSYCCPICPKSFKTLSSSPPPSLWQNLHIARGQFPPISSHSRLICDKKGCHWIYHSHFQCHGCPRPASHGSSKCGGALVCPSTLTHIVFPPDPLPCPPSGNISAALGVSPSIPSQNILHPYLPLPFMPLLLFLFLLPMRHPSLTVSSLFLMPSWPLMYQRWNTFHELADLPSERCWHRNCAGLIRDLFGVLSSSSF